MKVRHHSTVCYACAKHVVTVESASRNTAKSPPHPSLSRRASTTKSSHRDNTNPLPSHKLIDELTPTTIRLLGPKDFSNYLRTHYPQRINATDETTILLKEINAWCLSHLATARGHIHLEMMKFVHKIYGGRNDICSCCAACGFADCPPRVHTTTNDDATTTPVRAAIAGHRLHLSPHKGSTSTSKRPKSLQPPQVDSTPRHVLEALTMFAKQNLHAISELYIDLPNDRSTTIFGERRADLPGRKYVTRPGFQTDPWGRGMAPYHPQQGVAKLLQKYFLSALDSELASNFLVHGEPRFIRTSGFVIREQLVRDKIIGHELMSLLVRRFAQLDCQTETTTPYLSWRHPIEPEFSTLVLAGSNFLHTASIQKQLSADALKYDITSTQMFITPAPCLEGWIVIIWDMQLKILNVLDPLYHKSVLAPPQKDCDEALAWKLHNALFACLQEFYAGWTSPKEN